MFSYNYRNIVAIGSWKTSAENFLRYSTNVKFKYQLDYGVENSLNEEKFKPRHHPGIVKPKTILLPDRLIRIITNILDDQEHPRAQILKDVEKFQNYLNKRKPPMEQEKLTKTIDNLKKGIINKLNKTRPDLVEDTAVIKSQMNNKLKKTVYNWVPVKYDLYNSLLYLLARSPSEYAVLTKIFQEIISRDPKWLPRSLFDFGSGVGTATWAAKTVWPEKIFEYFNVDTSGEMNELSEHILKKKEKQNSLKGVYYRQFLPSNPVPYDLVVSAYSLMELPSLETRLETIKNLWRKVTKYLVIVEQGTNAGFSLVNEARDFILGLRNGHVFGPCPHDEVCPRVMLDDGTPCNFQVGYYTMPFGNQVYKTEKYSYVVLQKGSRIDDDPQWPRAVRTTLIRHKHCICNLCTNEGKIEQAVFSASKYGTLMYRCAKASEWGDRLPMNVKKECQTTDTETLSDATNSE